MFFIMSITDGQKKINFIQTVICKCCGKYGRYEVFMTYTCLSLFFIPTFKWNKHYYVKTSCCNSTYEISKELGERIAKGEKLEIKESDLVKIKEKKGYKKCPRCNYLTYEDFDFCPKCGERLQ